MMTGEKPTAPPAKPQPSGGGLPKDFKFGMSVIRKSQDNASQNRSPSTVHHG